MPERRRGRPPHPDLLTPAERRVLEELRKGGTNAEIAVRIGIGPETVKTHVSNMLAKLDLEDRQQLAAWREEDAPRRRWLWLLVPVPGKPLAVFGVVAGAAVVVAIILLLLGLVRGEEEALYIEGIGEIEGPVAVWGKREPFGPPYSVIALDVATGRQWDVFTTEESVEVLAAGDRLVVWSSDTGAIHSVSLDGGAQVLLQAGGSWTPRLSPDGSKIAFPVDGSPSGEADSIVVLDVQSGDAILRVETDDPRIDISDSGSTWEMGVARWSADGASLLAWEDSENPSFVLTLDGKVHEIPDERAIPQRLLSPDLRYRADALPWSRGVDSLAVVELATGRVVLALTAESHSRIWHAHWPDSGEFLYATGPGAQHDLLVWRLVDLDTGSVNIVTITDEKLRWLRWLQFEGPWAYDTGYSHCPYRYQGLDACSDLFDASEEVLYAIDGDYRDWADYRDNNHQGVTFLGWEFLGITWLD